MLILYNGCSVRGQAAFFDLREQMVQMDGCDELDDRVAQEFQPFVVHDTGLLLRAISESRHDIDQRIYT